MFTCWFVMLRLAFDTALLASIGVGSCHHGNFLLCFVRGMTHRVVLILLILPATSPILTPGRFYWLKLCFKIKNIEVFEVRNFRYT